MYVTYVLHLAILALLLPMAQNYDTKYTKANVPLWKQRACEKAQKQKASSHYICDDKGDVKCLPGWQGDLCQVPMCRKGCDPMNGYCQRPGECRCRIGYTGELCEKCIPLPGCQHGDCTKPFECICRPGWDGLFCTEPSCRQGCHSTRGYCEAPGECRCRIGWSGRNCSECAVVPGCQHGTCKKPLECNCLPGYTGLLCQMAICKPDCHKQHGYCKKPGECRCKVGWTGPNCDQCFPYPGCVHGDCSKPWECNCKPGWGGILCDEALTYCKEHPNTCENGGRCLSLTKEDGNYHCHCKQGYLGKNCEIVDEFMLTSTAAPRITPPPLIGWVEEEDDDDQDIAENLIKRENKTQVLTKIKPNLSSTLKQNETQSSENREDILGKLEKTYNTTTGSKEVFSNNTTQSSSSPSTPLELPTTSELDISANISSADIIGTATTNIMPMESSTPSPNNVTTKFTLPETNTSVPISPLSKLEDEKHQPTFVETTNNATNPLKVKNELATSGDSSDEEDDEECTDDDNDDECEYVDDEEEDEDDDDDKK